MQERERVVITCLVLLILILALGFFVHRSPRFAGSLSGGVLGVSGALLMASGLVYALIKRVGPLKNAVERKFPLRTLLSWHIYTGIIGAILALLHTGHKFQSTLGILLTGAMLIVVFTGYVGRYLFNQVAQEIFEKRVMLSKLQIRYDALALDLRRGAEPNSAFPGGSVWARLVAGLLLPSSVVAGGSVNAAQAFDLAEAMADVEYSIKMHDAFKAALNWWLKLHIGFSTAFYALLGIHIWSGLYYGLRWFHP